MIKQLRSFIKEELLPMLKKRRECGHEGETGEYCGKCGADIREISSYECRLCMLLVRNTVYKADAAPDFCRKCGAPRFTFVARKKKQAK